MVESRWVRDIYVLNYTYMQSTISNIWCHLKILSISINTLTWTNVIDPDGAVVGAVYPVTQFGLGCPAANIFMQPRLSKDQASTPGINTILVSATSVWLALPWQCLMMKKSVPLDNMQIDLVPYLTGLTVVRVCRNQTVILIFHRAWLTILQSLTWRCYWFYGICTRKASFSQEAWEIMGACNIDGHSCGC